MDQFRKYQKADCLDGTERQRSPYGCSCCRKIPDRGTFKKVSRGLARARLRAADRRAPGDF